MFPNIIQENLKEDFLVFVLFIIIFVILFEILYRIKLFRNKSMASIIAFLITLISLLVGWTRRLAAKILQISTSIYVFVLAALIALAFIFFLISSIIGKPIKLRKRYKR